MEPFCFRHRLKAKFGPQQCHETLIGANGLYALSVQDEQQHDVALDAFAERIGRKNLSPVVRKQFVSALCRCGPHQLEHAPNE